MATSSSEGSAPTPRLHVLFGDVEMAEPTRLEAAHDMLRGVPGTAIHLRVSASTRDVFEVARDLCLSARRGAGWCVINGRPDVALAVSAQAVQLGRTALGVGQVRAWWGEDDVPRIGCSVHTVAEARLAVSDGADYLVLGTIFSTPSHAERPGSGVSLIREVREALVRDLPRPREAREVREAQGHVPILAIGGLDLVRVPDVIEAGAVGVVVSRAVWSSADPVAAARKLNNALARAVANAGPSR